MLGLGLLWRYSITFRFITFCGEVGHSATVPSDGASVPLESIGVYSVATPSSYVAGDGEYITSETDKAIAGIVGRVLRKDILPTNTRIEEVANDTGLTAGHSFSDVYLKYRGAEIVGGIEKSLYKLTPKHTNILQNVGMLEDATSPCIAAPERTLAHKAAGLAFAVADPAAAGAKLAVVGAVKGVNAVGLAVGSAGKFVVEKIAGVFGAGQTDSPAAAQNPERHGHRPRSSGRREPLFVRLVGPFEDVLLYSLPETWGAFDLSELAGGPNAIWGQVRARDRNAILEVATLPLGGGTVLQVGKTSESRDELLSRFRRVLLLGLTAALVIGIAGGLFLTRSTLKPLRDLRDAVQRILNTGQTNDRVPVYGTDDAVDELSDLFNAMLARITTLIDGMRNALDHVAHDLRTPMTRLRVMAETALATNDPVKQREALSDVLEESDRVLSMLTTLMDISEAETGTMMLTRSAVDVATLVAEVIDLYEDTADEARVAVSASVAPGLVVSADRDRLRQALANLMDNAIKYTPAGGRVEVAAAREGASVVIRVRDTGAGIPAHDLPRIFDRLYRGDQSRATRGLGLGLSLVRAYIEAHGGTASVDSTPGKGATFAIRLPNPREEPP